MKAALPVIVAIAALSACVPASEPAPTAAPPPALRPVPARPMPPPPVVQAPAYGSWMDAPATPGSWRYYTMSGGSTAEFLSPDNERLAAIYCSYGREVFVAVHRAGQGPITIRTETASRTQIANLSGVFTRTLLTPNDPLLDAMALSKGRFAVEAEGVAPLYLPSHAEVSRVIEDCR